MTRRLAFPGLAVVAAVVVGGCAAPVSTGAAPASTGASAAGSWSAYAPLAVESGTTTASSLGQPYSDPTTSAKSAPVVVPEQLQFTATTLDGAPFDDADLAGKPAVLWFWAPWCPNCRAEAPQVATAASANPDVTFVGVAAQDDLPAMQSFVTDYGVDGFQHLADLDASIWQRFGVTYQPAYAFVGADGAVDVVKSRVSAGELDERLTQLVG